MTEGGLNEQSRHEGKGTGRSSIGDVGAEILRGDVAGLARPGI